MGEPQKDQAPRPQYKRSAKNYLLDPHFQLKYTAFLLGTALVLSLALGALLWRASVEVIDQTRKTVKLGEETVAQGRKTVEQGQGTVSRGKEVIVQSRKVSEVVSMNIAREYKDNPELAKTFGEEAAKDEAKLAAEQTQLEGDAARLEGDAAQLSQRAQQLQEEAQGIEERQRNVLVLLVVALGALVAGIGVAGIVVTHRIAGPVHKMKRMIRELGEGKLALRERLRKGDELQHLFDTFEKMVNDLRAKQKGEIAKVEAVIEGLDKGDQASLEALKTLRDEMVAELGD